MKANEAPEKIYIALDEIDDLALGHRFDYPICTEYTRTDAFIKMAEEFLYEKLNSGDIECGDIVTFINDFKKAMRV